MKLGKTLDLSKCFYDKDHWTHPDLKEGQLYIVQWHHLIITGRFAFGLRKDNKILFIPCLSEAEIKFGIEKSPLQEGWKHIQEVIV